MLRTLLLTAAALLATTSCTSPSSSPTAGPGAQARDYLSAQTYTSLTIEIQAVVGQEPTAAAKTGLVNFLQTYLNKPGGITIHVDTSIASPGKTSYSIADVETIEAARRTQHSSGSNLTAYFLFLDGPYSGNASGRQVLGIAHGPTSLVIFEKSIQDLSGGISQPTTAVLESTVMEHEFGHILGLTNTGSPMQTPHQDTANGKHCSNTACLMYWQVDTSDFLGNLLGGTVPQLDADCVADLHANGGL
jgi:hypothetical protein